MQVVLSSRLELLRITNIGLVQVDCEETQWPMSTTTRS